MLPGPAKSGRTARRDGVCQAIRAFPSLSEEQSGIAGRPRLWFVLVFPVDPFAAREKKAERERRWWVASLGKDSVWTVRGNQ